MADYDEAIPPGGEGKVTLQIDTSAFEGRAIYKALIQTNDPDRQEVSVYLSVNVKPPIRVSPATSLNLEGFIGETIRKEIAIESVDGKPLELSVIESDLDDWITYSITSESGASKYSVLLTDKGKIPRSYQGQLKLHTSHPLKKEIILNIHGHVKSTIEYWPQKMMFKANEKNDAINPKLLTIVNIQNKELKIKSIEFDENLVNVVLVRSKALQRNTQQIEIQPRFKSLPANKNKIEGNLLIRTEGDQAEEINIPLILQVEGY